MRDERVTEVGIDLEPRTTPRPSWAGLRAWLRDRISLPRRMPPLG